MKVMAIAPYEGLRELISKISERYKDIMEVTTVVGDLDKGMYYARIAEQEGYDIIISRGGTAEMITHKISIPVINIDVSGYDFLRAITTAKNFTGNKAIIGFSYITENARSVNELMKTDLDIFTVQSQEEVMPLLRKINNEKTYRLIIGDVITERTARELGFNGMLLTSGEESVESAFKAAIKICNGIDTYRKNSNMFQHIVSESVHRIAVFSTEKKLIYCNFNLADTKIKEYQLMRYIDNIVYSGSHDIVLKAENNFFSVRGKLIKIDVKQSIVAFYIDERDNNDFFRLTGITIKNSPYLSDGISGTIKLNSFYNEQTINTAMSFSKTKFPVLLIGDAGVGKSQMAYLIHKNCGNNQKPFISIDCSIVKEADIAKLLTSEDEYNIVINGCTICFEDINKMSLAAQRLIYGVLSSDNVKNKFRYIATCTSNKDMLIARGKLDDNFVGFFSNLSLYLPGIDERIEEINSLVNICIIESNNKLGKQIVGIEDDALKMLEKRQWKMNYVELRQAVDQLVINCKRAHITKEDVEEVLYARNDNTDNKKSNIDLNDSLEEIEYCIIQTILKQENGNLSKAAKRLGVGRSTLWRKLKHS